MTVYAEWWWSCDHCPEKAEEPWMDEETAQRELQEHMATEHPEEGYLQCPHGFHHPPHPHSCDGCWWCEGERARRKYGWPHDTTPAEDAPGEEG